jgi:hypothetical protein
MELTLLQVAKECSFPKALEGASDTSSMIHEVLMVVQGIVKVVFKVFVEQWSEHLVHVVLETGQCIHKSKGHYAELEGTE